MQINPETFKKLTEEKRISASRTLAGRIGRLQENDSPKSKAERKTGEPRGDTVKLLARQSLARSSPKCLAEEPESEAVREQELQKVLACDSVKLILDGETILAYGLVADRYGVDMTAQLLKAAPMLFTLLAEHESCCAAPLSSQGNGSQLSTPLKTISPSTYRWMGLIGMRLFFRLSEQSHRFSRFVWPLYSSREPHMNDVGGVVDYFYEEARNPFSTTS